MPGPGRSCHADLVKTSVLTKEHLRDPRTRTALRGIRLLVTGYLGLSVLTMVAIAVLHDHPAIVTQAVWVRGTIVVLSAALTYGLAAGTARGSRWAYLRLRLVSAIMVLAIAVIIAVPGVFPVWMKIEQGVCGVVLIGVALIVNGRHLRALFATGQPTQ